MKSFVQEVKQSHVWDIHTERVDLYEDRSAKVKGIRVTFFERTGLQGPNEGKSLGDESP